MPVQDDDKFLINRGGIDYKVSASGIDDKLQDDDQVLINRGGTDYKVSGADLRQYLGIAPVFLKIATDVEWEFNANNVPVVTKDATTVDGTEPITIAESIEYEIDPTPLTSEIPNTALEMTYFPSQDTFVCPYGRRDTLQGDNQGILHFSLADNTFSDGYQHPVSGSCRFGSFYAKSKDHEYVGVLFSKDNTSMSDGCLIVTNENGVEKKYDVSELPAKLGAGGLNEYLLTKFFFKTVGNEEYMYIGWYNFKESVSQMSYVSVTKNPIQFDSEGFPIIPTDINEHSFHIQSADPALQSNFYGIILGGVYHETEEALYIMARNAILVNKIDATGAILDATIYPTDGMNNTVARIVVTKNYIIKTIINMSGDPIKLGCIDKSTGNEVPINGTYIATVDKSRIFKLEMNNVIQYMDYDNPGNPADPATWTEYEPTNGQLLPNENLGSFAVVKENPFALIWDTNGSSDNALNVWGSKPLVGSDASVIQTFTDAIDDTAVSTVTKTVPALLP